MQAVEQLYKTNPEYFIYQKLRKALVKNNIDELYEEFPEAIESQQFHSFTKQSFYEISNNLNTSKYPVLFISYYIFVQMTSELTSNQKYEYDTMMDLFDNVPFTLKSLRILNDLANQLQTYKLIKALSSHI